MLSSSSFRRRCEGELEPLRPAVIAADDTNIRNLDSRESGDGGAIVDFVVFTQNLTHLNKLVMDLRRIPGVKEVQRSQKI